MKTMGDMTTSELMELEAVVDRMIRDLIRSGRPVQALVSYRCAIDDELDSRGA